jgi:PIN domain nuclease of toxin-antitoxin system
LPEKLREQIIAAPDACFLSPVSIWELGLLVSRRRYELDAPLREWVDDAHRQAPFPDAPLTREVALRSREVELEHQDPADRFLVATALVYELTLLTVDARLTRLAWLPTGSD